MPLTLQGGRTDRLQTIQKALLRQVSWLLSVP